jgi:hypothetical protein
MVILSPARTRAKQRNLFWEQPGRNPTSLPDSYSTPGLDSLQYVKPLATWTGGVRAMITITTLPRFYNIRTLLLRLLGLILIFHLEHGNICQVVHEHLLCITIRRIKITSGYSAGYRSSTASRTGATYRTIERRDDL